MSFPSQRQSYKGSVLFVNRDATNVLKRDEKEAFAVNSHVSSTYRHWFRNRRIGEVLSAPRTSPVAWRARNEYQEEEAGGKARVLVDRAFKERIYDNTPPATSHRRIAPAKTPSRQPHHLSRSLPSQKIQPADHGSAQQPSFQFPYPFDLLTTGNSDPFSTAATPLAPFHVDLISNWRHRYTYYLTPLGSSPAARNVASDNWHSEVRDSLSSEMLLHGIFAGALVFLSSHPGHSAAELRRRGIIHQTKCLSLIRKSVTQGVVNAELLQAVAFAAVADFFKRDIAACEVHIQAMKALTDMQGGLERLPRELRPKLILSDLEIADSCARRTVFRVGSWDVEDRDWQRWNLCGALHMSEGREEGEYHRKMPEELRELFRRHREVLRVHCSANALARTNEAAADRMFAWLHTRKFALIARSLDVYHEMMENPNPCIVEVSLALAVNYCQRLIIDARFENIMSIPIHNLRRNLEPVLMEHLPALEDIWPQECLLWMLFVGACAESLLLNAATDPAGWFMIRFATLRKAMGTGLHDVTACFEGFLYDQTALDSILRRLLG